MIIIGFCQGQKYATIGYMEVITAPNPKLRVKTKPVKKLNIPVLKTLKDMIKLTLTFKDPEGVGLASTQVGLEESFFVAKHGKIFVSVINPKILSTSKKTKKYFEGCLSIPGTWGEVIRHTNIKVSYTDEYGKTVNRPLKGLLAWVFQHEIDHLNGILFPDKVLKQGGRFYKYTGKDKTGTDTFEEIKI